MKKINEEFQGSLMKIAKCRRGDILPAVANILPAMANILPSMAILALTPPLHLHVSQNGRGNVVDGNVFTLEKKWRECVRGRVEKGVGGWGGGGGGRCHLANAKGEI